MLRYGKGTLLTTVMAGLLALSLLTAGCGSATQTKSAAVSVKAMKVLQQDTAVSHDYSGQIKSTNAVTIKPRVSGEIVEKYFTAGDPVEKGQPCIKSTTANMNQKSSRPNRMSTRPGRRSIILSST